ncbi:hypothetical protein MtrunA17_Chr3g0126991 [Medicago truncatula]|uniref:Uncharacterized protein n=1 Tax=Medicago truncatula TaxID=3880 RepID=A0A396IZV8_MEDTR|nr:hypothetical protein MtrunA17_Chr3g0126991 [Medicago truncatula]
MVMEEDLFTQVILMKGILVVFSNIVHPSRFTTYTSSIRCHFYYYN